MTAIGVHERGQSRNRQPVEGRRAHLRIEGLSAGYGRFLVLRGVTLEARPGITVILGPNGAGKTTLLKAVAGLIGRGGRVLLDGVPLPPEARPSQIVERGLALVPEGRQLFPQMTVRENLELGGWLIAPAERARRMRQAFDDFPKLAQRAGQLAGTMSGGEQQMVAVGRAIMSAPKILLLDEPSLGLSPLMCQELFRAIERIRSLGVGILMVEQNANLSLGISDRGYLIETGRIVGEGTAAQLREDPAVQRAYLGSH